MSMTLGVICTLGFLLIFVPVTGHKMQTTHGADNPVYALRTDEDNVMRLSKLKITPENTLVDSQVAVEIKLSYNKVPGAKYSHDYVKKQAQYANSSITSNRNSRSVEQKQVQSLGDKQKLDELHSRIQREIDEYIRESSHSIQAQTDRQTTSSAQSHTIEVLFVVDYLLYLAFLSRNGGIMANTVEYIQAYYSQILRATNDRFASASYGEFSVKLTITSIIIRMTQNDAPWSANPESPYFLNPTIRNPLFSGFSQFLKLQLGMPHDLAVLFTRARYACTLTISNMSPFNPDPYLVIPFGQAFNADTQCSTPLNQAAVFCRDYYSPPSFYGFDEMCYNLRCTPSVVFLSSLCQPTIAHDGTVCGLGKTCFRGLCVRDLTAPLRPDFCPQGDDPRFACSFFNCLNATEATIYCCETCSLNNEISTVPPFLPALALDDSEPDLFRLLFDDDDDQNGK